MQQATLTKYIQYFTKLRRDRKNGGAPHKPVLLLSIIELFEKEIQHTAAIKITPELVGCFKNIWNRLVITNHHPIFALPFYHMNSEPFWKLIANPGYEKWIASKSSMRSLKNLTTAVNYSLLDKEMVKLLLEPDSRKLLKIALLKKYFPDSYLNLDTSLISTIPNISLLNEPSEIYRKKHQLKLNFEKESFHEEIFVRGGLFKREIPKIYDNTCAISNLKIDAALHISMIDACHIEPFSENYNDTIQNGIALSPNLHRAFDRGLIAISDSYKVLVSKNFVENNSVYNIHQFQGVQIKLPREEKYYPSLQNLQKHRIKFGF